MAPSPRYALIGLLSLVSAQNCPFAAADKRDLLAERGSAASLDTLAHSFGKCPTVNDAAGGGTRSQDWWPCQLKLDVLRQFSPEQNPLGGRFNYAEAFARLDCTSSRGVVSLSTRHASNARQHRQATQSGHQGIVEAIAALVAGRLWHLRRPLYPYVMA